MSKIKTYLKIIDFLQESNRREFYPKVIDIVEQLEKSDIILAERSVQRYLSALNTEFSIYIDQKGKHGGYEICIDEIPNFNKIYETFRILEKADYFKEVISNARDSLQYISYDGKQFTGYHNIEIIVNAIVKGRVIKITHKKFGGNETERKVKPYLLKEYNNRWYLVGFDYKSNDIRTFGLDRVIKIEITTESFDKTEAEKTIDYFKDVIGIIKTQPPEKVVLKVNDSQVDYFRTYPWHESTTIEKNKNNEWIVSMFVSVNYELEQLILTNQTRVQVIKPQHLVDRIKTILTDILKIYS